MSHLIFPRHFSCPMPHTHVCAYASPSLFLNMAPSVHSFILQSLQVHIIEHSDIDACYALEESRHYSITP